MKKVLITGASGFIGYHLVQRLRNKGYDIHCLVRPTSDVQRLLPLEVSLLHGDLTDSESCRSVAKHRFDLVFHLAGKVRAVHPRDFHVVNEGGTRNLVESCLAMETPPVLVYVSSLAAAGPAVSLVPKVENDLPAPISGYGKSKLACERLLASHASKIACTVVRPAIVFGEADTMNLKLFQTIERLGICPIPGWQDRVYSWIHAADLVELLLLVAERGERLQAESLTVESASLGSGIYFGSANEGIRLSEMGQLIGLALGRKRTRVVRCPPTVLWAISSYYEMAKRITGKDQPFDWDKATEARNHWMCSPKKSHRLGFTMDRSLAERIGQTVSWYREKGCLMRKFSPSGDVSPS